MAWRSGSVVGLDQQSSPTLSPVSTRMGDHPGFDSRRRHFISVFNQPPRSTQPSTLRGTVK